MHVPNSMFVGAKSILDVGGWFKPEPRATHVLDLMPWETRGAKLSLSPLPGEQFSKATWAQADFLKPDFRIPFPDKSFDLVICGHTIEDLTNPEPLLREMERVGKRGIIECPSRWSEQTRGIRDRATNLPGHPHHHWIVESVDDCLHLYSKQASRLDGKARLLPLCFTEQQFEKNRDTIFAIHAWTNALSFRVFDGAECQAAAEKFVALQNVPPADRLRDFALRFARRLRNKLRGNSAEDFSWWPKIVAESQPFSSIELQYIRPGRKVEPNELPPKNTEG